MYNKIVSAEFSARQVEFLKRLRREKKGGYSETLRKALDNHIKMVEREESKALTRELELKELREKGGVND